MPAQLPPAPTPPTRTHRLANRWRWVRLVLAVVVAGALALGIWWVQPDQLTQPDDIVGYPSFFNFNYHPIFLAHRLAVWFVPVVAAAIYLALGRFGPLRDPDRAGTPGHFFAASVEQHDEGEPGVVAVASRPPWRSLGPLVPVGALLGLSTVGAVSGWPLRLAGLLVVALVYVGVVRAISRLLPAAREAALAQVNAAGAVVATGAAVFVYVWRTAVVDRAGDAAQVRWIPWWLILVVTVVGLVVVSSRLRRGDPVSIESFVVRVVVGSALVYLLTASLPGGMKHITGFDDSQSVVVADLLTRGYFPWRDVFPFHGIFEDGFRSNVGFLLFQRSYWGAYAAMTMVWVPMFCVGSYLVVVWASGRRWLPAVAYVVVIPWLAVYVGPSIRWAPLGFVLVLLGECLRRRRTIWTVAYTVVLFLLVIGVPETSYLVIGSLVVLPLCDLGSAPRAVGWWTRFALSRVFVVAGAVSVLVWIGFLALNGALGAWIDYYRIVGPGHAASGTIPLDLASTATSVTGFVVVEVAIAATLLLFLLSAVARARLTSRGGLLLASTLLVGLYAEKGLGRFDDGHIRQVLTVALPFVCVGLIVVSEHAHERWVGRAPTSRRVRIASIGTVAVLAVVVVVVLPFVTGSKPTPVLALRASDHNRATVASLTIKESRIGYQTSSRTTREDNRVYTDLRRLLGWMTPPGGSVYDFTNSPGIFTYLLQERLATPFFTIGVALPAAAQELVVDDLVESRPDVVVFDSLAYGLPVWDGPRNEVRHFVVSPYLLSGWRPVATTDGFTILLRNDLSLPSTPPPDLSGPIGTSDLYFGAPACEWGYIPDYLASRPTGQRATLEATSAAPGRRVAAKGWAYDTAGSTPVARVALAVDGRVIADTRTTIPRPDVANTFGASAATAGYSIVGSTTAPGRIRTYAVLADGTARTIGGAGNPRGGGPDQLVFDDGTTAAVVHDRKLYGAVDTAARSRQTVSTFAVPAGLDLADYGLASFSAGGARIGPTKVELSDSSPAASVLSRDITFQTAGRAKQVGVRVGACLQWHGYRGQTLSVVQRGGRPITTIELSGVAGVRLAD